MFNASPLFDILQAHFYLIQLFDNSIQQSSFSYSWRLSIHQWKWD